MNNTVYIIAGPTAVGKSLIAQTLARRINGEIINCDSVQLYRQMDIGSAKPDDEEMKVVKHHLYSIVDPDYNMTAATYQKLAHKVIDNVLEREKTPIVVGGTGLYINSIMYDMEFGGKTDDGTRRNELEEMAEKNGSRYMHDYLAAIDPVSASRIHPNNLRKTIRAIEAYELGDGIKPLDSCPLIQKYNFKFFALTMDRDWLYRRINMRVLELYKKGLLEEFNSLVEMGYDESTPAMKAIGYKELFEYKNGNATLEECIKKIMSNTRHYAKRQLTWLRRYDNVQWIEIRKDESVKSIVDRILNEE